MKVNIVIEKDGEGYLARVQDQQNLFACAYSEKEAVTELKHVVDMLLDYHLEQANNEKIISNKLGRSNPDRLKKDCSKRVTG